MLELKRQDLMRRERDGYRSTLNFRLSVHVSRCIYIRRGSGREMTGFFPGRVSGIQDQSLT